MRRENTPDRAPPQLSAADAPLIASHEIAEAFFVNSHRLDDAERAYFLARGISDQAIESDPGRNSGPIRAASVLFDEQFFDFASEKEDGATKAFAVIVRDEFGVTSDIVAFDETQFGLWLGRAPVIGQQMIFAPRLDEPLLVFEDVWAWLRAERDGVFPIDWKRTASLLEDTTLAVDTVAFGQILRERLARPAPPIFVRKAAA